MKNESYSLKIDLISSYFSEINIYFNTSKQKFLLEQHIS